MNIRLRLTLWFTLLVVLISSLVTLLGWIGMREEFYRQSEAELHDKQQEIQHFIEALAHEFEKDGEDFALDDNVASLEAIFAKDQTSFYDNIFIQISNARGQVISRSSKLGRAVLPILPATQSRPQLLVLHLGAHSARPLHMLYTTASIQVHGQVLGAMQLGLSMLKTEHLLSQMLIFQCLTIILAALLALILGQILATRALAPMQQVTHQVQQMSGQALFQQLDTRDLAHDEIGELVQTFNDLLLRIENVFVTQKRFVTDASHEFKSPLTSIRGHAQLIRKRGVQNPEILAKGVDTIVREAERLTRLVDDLLLLARLEGQGSAMKPLDATALIRELYLDLKPLHPDFRIEGPSSPIWVRGHADSLKRVLLNLLDNAFKVTRKADGQVVLSWGRKQEQLWLQIQDNGPGIEAEHLPHLFERFYRVDSSRARESGGSGIGLALAQDLVRVHQGSIQVRSQPGQTVFDVHFPLLKTSLEEGD